MLKSIYKGFALFIILLAVSGCANLVAALFVNTLVAVATNDCRTVTCRITGG